MHSEVQAYQSLFRPDARTRVLAIAAAVLVILAILVIYADTVLTMAGVWRRSETFAHGYLIAPAVLWLIWRSRDRLAHVPLRPFPAALAGIALAGFGWLVAQSASVVTGSEFMVVAMIPFAVWAILGTRMLRALAFPLAFLFFAVPFGEFLVPVLMEWTADFTIAALRLTGVPVLREGNNFAIPSGSWSVVEACSGVRYLIASLVVGTLYAELTYRSLKRRLVFIAVSALVPLVANWLRAYMIVMIGHLSGNRLAVGVDHLIYGWLFFGVVMLLLFWVAAFWREPDATPAERQVPFVDGSPYGAGRVALVCVAAMVMVGAWRPVLAIVDAQASTAPVRLSAIVPANGWQGAGAQADAFRPHFVRSRADTLQAFTKGDARVTVYVAFYRAQTQSSELVGYDNQIVTTSDPRWTRVGSRPVAAVVNAAPVRVRSTELRSHEGRLLAWQWYWMPGHVTSDDYAAKAYLALSRLLGRGDDSAVVVIYTSTDSGGRPAPAILKAFAEDMSPSIERVLAEAAQR